MTNSGIAVHECRGGYTVTINEEHAMRHETTLSNQTGLPEIVTPNL